MRCEKCHRDAPSDAVFCPYCGGELQDAAEPAEFEYAAFISYRHLPRDQEVAKRVQHVIETYRMPRNISQGAKDGHLGKCFRDEDELAAAHSLPDRILDALGKSSSLVVVCTPDTKESIWVRREVTEFIKMRGRERVFVVLADGSSAESIPDYLRPDGVSLGDTGQARSNPLAADLRPEASGKARDELIRLMAAIANCEFDDLKQRDRVRRRKRGAAAAIAAVIVVAAIVAAFALASNARQDALSAESRKLAAESEQLLSQGDRYGALEKALEALPQSESSNDRPLVPEARAALEAALELSPHADSVWQASYEIRTEAPLGVLDNTMSHVSGVEENRAGAIAVSDSGGFFAVSDSSGNIATYDVLTGKKLADCEMPEDAVPLEGGLYVRTMAATERFLVVGNGCGDGKSVLACFEANTGNLAWSSQGAGCPSFNTSFGNDLLSMAFPITGGGYAVAIANLETNQIDTAEFPDAGISRVVMPYFNTPGERLGTNYAVFSDRLFATEVGAEKSKGVNLAYPVASSLAFLGGLVVASSAEYDESDEIVRNYAVEAFDKDLAPAWRYEGSFDTEMIVNNGITSFLAAEPVVYGAIKDGSGILVGAGREVMVLDAKTGKLRESMQFSQTVVDATLFDNVAGGGETVVVVCSDGTVNCRDLFEGSDDPKGDGRRLALPFPIRWARMANCDGSDVLLVVPADADNRLVSYRTDWTRGEESGEPGESGESGEPGGDYTLDALIDLAKQVLADAGRR